VFCPPVWRRYAYINCLQNFAARVLGQGVEPNTKVGDDEPIASGPTAMRLY